MAADRPAVTPPAQPAADTPSARISHSGNSLLQTLNQQQPRTPPQHLVRFQLEARPPLELVSPRPLQPGQSVTLTRVGEQQVQLQPQPPAPAPTASRSAQTAMQQALREALPQQLPFGDALNQLVQLSQSPAMRGQNAIQQLVQSMLGLFSVNPGSAEAASAIRRNLQQGGLLTEAQLARADHSRPPTELKQQLGQLLKAAEQLPAEPRQQLQRLVDALQARSTTQQVSSLQAWKELPDGSQERLFRLDLPIRQDAQRHDNAELTLRERRSPRDDGGWQSVWSAALHFDLEQQGSIDARLSLQEGWRLQLQFWAESSTTLRRLEQRLQPFSQALHQQGFIVDRIQARQGTPQDAELTPLRSRLVDLHT